MKPRSEPRAARLVAPPGARVGLLGLILGLASGCGPDPQVVAKQDEEIRREYERQKAEPKWMTPQEKQIRRERLELEYGGVAPK